MEAFNKTGLTNNPTSILQPLDDILDFGHIAAGYGDIFVTVFDVELHRT